MAAAVENRLGREELVGKDFDLMGKPYEALFSEGERVKIAAGDVLERFHNTWEHHHKLEAKQLPYAGRVARVASVGYYHGGDVLYQLEGIPGIWHECCLTQFPYGENSN
jgi:hypothetical protein